MRFNIDSKKLATAELFFVKLETFTGKTGQFVYVHGHELPCLRLGGVWFHDY